jgi:hypothetical protein
MRTLRRRNGGNYRFTRQPVAQPWNPPRRGLDEIWERIFYRQQQEFDPLVGPPPIAPRQINANQPRAGHAAVEGAVEGFAAGVGVYEAIQWQRYKHAVGVENTSLRGFRIWKSRRR